MNFNDWITDELSKNDKSLIGFWPLHGNILDYSGRGKHFNFYNNTAPDFIYRNPFYELKFDRSNNNRSYLDGSTRFVDFKNTDHFSISCLCSFYDQGSSHTIISALNSLESFGTPDGWMLRGSLGDGILRFIFGAGLSQIQFDATYKFIAKEIYHIAIVYNPENGSNDLVTFFVNGHRIPHTIVSTSFTQPSYNYFRLGNIQSLGNDAPYTLSKVRLYNRSLSPTEVLSIYTRDYPFVPDADVNRSVSQIITLFMGGSTNPSISNKFELFEKGSENLSLTSKTDIFLKSSLESSHQSNFDLFIKGGTGYGYSSSFNLFEKGSEGAGLTKNLELRIAGYDSFDLFMAGHLDLSNNIPLFMSHAFDETSGNINLFLKGDSFSSFSSSIPLFMRATAESGFAGSIDLYTFADSPSDYMNLFLAGNDSLVESSHMSLFIKGGGQAFGQSITLFLDSEFETSNFPLYIQGQGGLDGGLPTSTSVNLFMERPEGASIDMFLKTTETLSSSNMPLFTLGSMPISSGINLVIPNTYSYESGFLQLYTHGF